VKTEHKAFLLCLLAGIGFWVLDAALDCYVSHEGAFWNVLVLDIPAQEVYDRSAAFLAFVVLGLVIAGYAAKRRRAEERIEHLNTVLRAVRNINQLIVRETDHDTLLKRACETLVHTRGYYNAWIAVLDESGSWSTWAEAGLAEAFEPMARGLEAGRLPECGRTALAQPGVVVVEDPALTCSDCPLAESYGGLAGMTVQLAHGGKVFGLLAVSIPRRFVADEEEKGLLEELAADLAFALHDLEVTAARKRAAEALRESEKKYRTLVETAQEGIGIVDPDENILFCNRAYGRLLGYEPEELIGLNLQHLTVPEEFAKYREQTQKRKGGEASQYETVLYTKAGDAKYFSLSASPLCDDAGTFIGTLGLITDITERKRAEEERERLVAELEQKNAELERFAYTVSHDLKGPLITIKGFAGLLEKGIAEGTMEQVHEDLRRISGAADRMHQLLDELLDLSRVGRVVGPPEDVPLADLAREAMELMALRVGESGVEVHIPPDLPVVRGDRPRLLSVMQNLMDNAVKFMGDQPQPRVEVGGRHHGGETLCWVRDNGIGIDPRYHDRIFGLFDQLHRGASEGTGIGLAITKRVVEVHGGRIWVESKGEGHGSTFCFALPREGASTNGEDE